MAMVDKSDLAIGPQTESNEGAGTKEGGTEQATQRAAAAPLGAVAGELPADLASAYQKLVAEKAELYDRLLRKQAELENYRKRVQRDKEDFLQHATDDLIRALLPVLDSLERALDHCDATTPEPVYQGMELIYRELTDVLGRAGLTPIETAGQLFDPRYHQAIEVIESPGHRDQEIIEELQRGYKLKQRLLRPAIVKVAMGPRGDSSEPQSDDATPAK